MTQKRPLPASLALLLLASACGRGIQTLSSIGALEGEVDLVAFPGTVEDGSNDSRVDWVHPFEAQTGCVVAVRYATTAEEAVGLLRQKGSFDGGVVSSDQIGRLIGHGDVAPLDRFRLAPDTALMKPLRPPDDATVGGRRYATPFVYGPNLLLYNSAVIRRPPTSWRLTWRPNSPYRGRITTQDVPIFLADAALYLKAHDHSLGIRDPFELTAQQLRAAVLLVKQQADLVGRYWAQFTDEIIGFAGGGMLVGVGRPIVIDLSRSAPVRGVVPSEGVTGWVDEWVMAAHAAHPNCMYRWLQWSLAPTVQSSVAQWYGAAPANPAACPLLRRVMGTSADTIGYGKCGDVRFLDSLHLWKTPLPDCGDGRQDCMDYAAWARAWQEIPGT